MQKNIPVVIGLWLLATCVQADEPAMEDFAFGYKIVTDGSAPIYRIPIPAEIYQRTTRNDLGDVRVFNNQHESIPFALRTQAGNQRTESSWVDLPLFPIEGDVDNRNDNQNVDIKVDASGKILSIHYGANEPVELSAPILRYVIDLSSVKQNIDELEFSVEPDVAGYLKSVYLEKSEDLAHWSTVVSNATLSRLNYANHSLEKNTINIPNQHMRYLRFTWRDNSEGLRLQSVRALLTSTTNEQTRNWGSVTATRSDKDNKVYYFDLGGHYPVNEITVELPDNNTLIDATLQSRNDEKAVWITQHSGLFYKLDMKGTEAEPLPEKIRTTTDRYWQLTVRSDEGIGDALPSLKFAWTPQDLYFLARGDGPYTLAYGNASAMSPQLPVGSLMHMLSGEQQQNMIRAASLGQKLTFKGDAALTIPKQFPWRTILLWVILISAVIVLITMAWRLIKEMNQNY